MIEISSNTFEIVKNFLGLLRTRVLLDSEVFGERLLEIVCEQTYSQARLCREGFIFVAGPNRNNLDPVRCDINLEVKVN